MKEEMLSLKKAIDDLAETLGMEVYELCMEEDTDVYNDFGKKYGKLASEVYKDIMHQGLDLRVSILGVAGRCKECNAGIDSVEFWEDLAVIVCLVEALEVEGYCKELNFTIMKKESYGKRIN